MLFVDLCIQGVIQGAIYALIALGLTLVYGLLRILHVAHAALFTLGGYIGVVVTNGSGSFLLALVTAMFVVGVVGMSSYKIIYEPLLKKNTIDSTYSFDWCIHRLRRIIPNILRRIWSLLHHPPLTSSS